jgi:hypothetical protein
MPRIAATLLLVFLGALALARPGHAEPVALIADLAGEVRTRTVAGAVGERSAVLMQRLQEDTTLALGAGARATVFYPGTGAAFELLGGGEFRIGANEAQAMGGAPHPTRRQLNAAFRDIKLERVHITQAGVVMRSTGNSGGPQLLGPEGLEMSSRNPMFRWTAAESGGRYRFRLTDTAGEPVYETTTTETEVVLPADIVLKPGRRLMWSVQSAGRLSPNRWANLIVADAAVRQMAVELDRGGEPASEAERNLRALLLTQAALRGE